MDGYQRVAELMKALAHPVRLQILDVLDQEGEACVCHLESRLDQRQAYISQQLSKLREVGLVSDRRDGLNVFYALSTDRLKPFIEDAKALVNAVSGAKDTPIEFASIRHIQPEQCKCPSCEERLALA
ncbi:MAG: ArsR/SmtB family transcription factor [Anaerolineales bacterium]